MAPSASSQAIYLSYIDEFITVTIPVENNENQPTDCLWFQWRCENLPQIK